MSAQIRPMFFEINATMEPPSSASRLSGSLLTPSTVDEVTVTPCTDAFSPPSVERLKGAYQRASLVLQGDGVSHVFPSEPASWERKFDKLETEDDRLSNPSQLTRAPSTASQMAQFSTAQIQVQRTEEQMRKVFRDISALRQDVDTVMLLSSKAESQQAEATRNWSVAQANLAKESMDLLIHLTEDQKMLKEEFRQETKLLAELQKEIRHEAASRREMGQILSQEREQADADIVGSIRQVVDQGASFREIVLKEAAEQRSALAKEIQLNLQQSLDQRITDLRDDVDEIRTQFSCTEQEVASLKEKCDPDRDATLRTLIDSVAIQCTEVERKVALHLEDFKASSLKLQTFEDSREEYFSNAEAESFMQQSRLELQQFCDQIKHQLQQHDEAMVVVADNLQDEIKERSVLSDRLHSETDQRLEVTSAVSLEVSQLQQQLSELQGSLQVAEIYDQLALQKESTETRYTSLLSSLEDWKEKISTSVEKQKEELSALRGHMTDHMSWVEQAHAAQAEEIKLKAETDQEQIKELFGHVSHLHEIRASDVVAVKRHQTPTSTPGKGNSGYQAPLSSAPLATRRSSSSAPRATSAATGQVQLRSASPMSHRGSVTGNSYACSMAAPSTHPVLTVATASLDPAVMAHAKHNGASITVSAHSDGTLTRVPSTGVLSARFVGTEARRPSAQLVREIPASSRDDRCRLER